MSEQTKLTVYTSPETVVQEAVEHYNILVQFVKSVMKPGKDYGTIPGTDKPTLLKPGAEKLNTLFKYAPRFTVLDKIIDFDKGFFYFQYEASIYNSEGRLIATGNGSCNSKEKKYRYRNIPAWKATEAEKAGALRTEKKQKKSGGDYTVYVVENAEPFDLTNTIDKMAQKRALIAATLIAANASEFFTQDVEDLDLIEGEFEETPKPTPPQNNDEPPTQKAWDAYNNIVKEACELNIVTPIPPENVTTAQLRALYAEVKSQIKAKKSMQEDPAPEPPAEPPAPAPEKDKVSQNHPPEKDKGDALIDFIVAENLCPSRADAIYLIDNLKITSIDDATKKIKGYYGWLDLSATPEKAIGLIKRGEYPH